MKDAVKCFPNVVSATPHPPVGSPLYDRHQTREVEEDRSIPPRAAASQAGATHPDDPALSHTPELTDAHDRLVSLFSTEDS